MFVGEILNAILLLDMNHAFLFDMYQSFGVNRYLLLTRSVRSTSEEIREVEKRVRNRFEKCPVADGGLDRC
jgi:hypothetical protein